MYTLNGIYSAREMREGALMRHIRFPTILILTVVGFAVTGL